MYLANSLPAGKLEVNEERVVFFENVAFNISGAK
jgi:hypothetical protein